MQSKKIAVVGLGRFGSAIAKKLVMLGAEVMGIDNNADRVEDLKDILTYTVILDSTDPKALLSQNIPDMDAVVIAIGASFQDLMLTTYALQEVGVQRIIARAQDERQKRILEKMGVKEIMSIEEQVSNGVAQQLINPSVLMAVQLPDDYEIIEINAPKNLWEKKLSEIGLREKYNLNLVTVLRKTDSEHHILGVPYPDTMITEGDLVILFGRMSDVNKFMDINK
ncbi:MAG: TrkA family potassium uptake protein [Flavobacteriales bacterium]|nr:MAG: TrkA family potassium uptake protein [Flavobacteriales bacterium]